MDRRKLEKLRDELEGLRTRSVRAADIQSLASRLGRKVNDRGKHPMWLNTHFPKLRPLSIPDHGQRDLSKRVQKCVLVQLEEDLDAWDRMIAGLEAGNGNGQAH